MPSPGLIIEKNLWTQVASCCLHCSCNCCRPVWVGTGLSVSSCLFWILLCFRINGAYWRNFCSFCRF